MIGGSDLESNLPRLNNLLPGTQLVFITLMLLTGLVNPTLPVMTVIVLKFLARAVIASNWWDKSVSWESIA